MKAFRPQCNLLAHDHGINVFLCYLMEPSYIVKEILNEIDCLALISKNKGPRTEQNPTKENSDFLVKGSNLHKPP